MVSKTDPIGVFDSGIGGLSVANAIYGLLPKESIHYFADTGRVPYGPRSKEQIQSFAHQISGHLLRSGCKMIVVACNTATAAALESLRTTWPDVPFVGMEPAVKPAALATRTQKVGVLATQATINSERYAELMRRYAQDVQVLENPCIGLVPRIEAGELQASTTRDHLQDIVDPMLEAGVDTLVLGCTHYPFIRPVLETVLPKHIQIIDPAPAVARQVERRLENLDLLSNDVAPVYQLEASGGLPNLSIFTDIPF